MKIDKLKAKTIKELIIELEQRKVKLYNYELDLKSGKEKDTGKVRSLRRDVARILTIMNQKKETDLLIGKEEVIEDKVVKREEKKVEKKKEDKKEDK